MLVNPRWPPEACHLIAASWLIQRKPWKSKPWSINPIGSGPFTVTKKSRSRERLFRELTLDFRRRYGGDAGPNQSRQTRTTKQPVARALAWRRSSR